jgi:hypothetical protein
MGEMDQGILQPYLELLCLLTGLLSCIAHGIMYQLWAAETLLGILLILLMVPFLPLPTTLVFVWMILLQLFIYIQSFE